MVKKEKKSLFTSLFDTLSAINVNSKTEKKSGLTYLTWSFAWAEFKKVCPTATYKVKEYGEDKKPYLNDPDFGIIVMTEVTVGNETHEMWLPVMDGANKAMKTVAYTYTVKDWDESRRQNKNVTKEKNVEPASMFDINKTLMRCLVKNLAMFGLGIYIYAGDDLPEGWVEPMPEPIKETVSEKKFEALLKGIEEGKYTEDKMKEDYQLSEPQQSELDKFMSDLEEQIETKTAG